VEKRFKHLKIRGILKEIAILGSGMAGFGAAYKFHNEGIESTIYEKESYYGGHTASFYSDGFIFDDGPHLSFTKTDRIQDLLAENVNNDYEEIHANTSNYWRGYWIKHPAQCNLYGLPTDLVVDIINDFIYVQNSDNAEINNYKDWLIANYGETFANTFPMEYGLKFHTTEANNMATDWVAPRFYRPDLKEVLLGALSPKTTDVHYINKFRYPSKGGFVSFLNKFNQLSKLRFNHEVIKIDTKERLLGFSNGFEKKYEHCISSIALPELIKIIQNVPDEVLMAAQKLACTTCIVVNLGVDRDNLSEAHWAYFYDRDIFFTRLSFPHMLSQNNAPPGCGSIQAEVYYSKKYRPVDRPAEECISPVIDDLKKCGILLEDDKIIFKDAKIIPYANVIFDLDRQDALSIVHGYLDEIGIHYCGRYGEWGYHWTDESFISGEMVAQRTIDSLR